MRYAALLLVVPYLLAGCAATQPAPTAPDAAPELESLGHVHEAGMPCAQATTVARQAVLKLGYTVETVEPAKPGAPGRVVGKRNTGWLLTVPEDGDVYTTEIRVTCADTGADFEARTDEGFTRRFSLRREFPPAIAAVIAQPTRRPRAKQEPDQGLLIVLEPQRSRDSNAEFGADLPASGVTPLRVRIENRTTRTYGFQRAQVKMVTQEGKRVDPLAPSSIGQLAGGLQAQLEEKLIGEGDLTPGATLKGFIYFPSSAYRRASVVLLDRESEEPEGFAVEF